MREHQEDRFVEDITRVLAEPGPHEALIEGKRILWGATHDEALRVVRGIDEHAAREYRDYLWVVTR